MKREHKFASLLESAPDAMVIVDEMGHIIVVNSQTEALFGYSRKELLGQPVEILVPIRYRDRHPHYRNDYINDPHLRPMGAGRHLSGLRKDDSEFPVEISLSPVRTDEGLFISSAIRDVTSGQKAEEELRSSEATFRGLLESAPDAMVIVDHGGTFVMVNAQTESLFGYHRSDILGRPVEVLIPGKFHCAVKARYSASVFL